MHGASVFLGRTFGGKFTIIEKIGEGGMGSVFRSVGPDGRWVAVKILHPGLADDEAYYTRFVREARMAARIDHPNAVHTLDHGTEDGIPYIVMELVEGRELFDVLAAEGRLSPARAAAIVMQICDAVATAHDLGIVHRDLKPENVMLTGDPASPGGERVKLFDFGVAKQMAESTDEDGRVITVAGTLVGTPAYMSPEQCVGDEVDARSDVYACGAVLYHLVTGRPPFDAEGPMQTLFRHVHEEPRPPSATVPGLDRDLEATILKALRKRPEDRHQGASELWEELLAALPRLSSSEVRAAPAAPPKLQVTMLAPPVPAAPHPGPSPSTVRPRAAPHPPTRGATWAEAQNPPPGAVHAQGHGAASARRTPRTLARPGMRRWAPVIVGVATAAAVVGLGIVGVMGGTSLRSVPVHSARVHVP